MRADKFLAEKYGSRSKAKIALLDGKVLLHNQPLSPDDDILETDDLVFLPDFSFVSQGGDKLEKGLQTFEESVENCVVADLGASTGGFTDCVLRRGARKVYCIDVGENQLDPRIKGDPRVAVMDRSNARYLSAKDFPEKIDVVVADLSFISLRLILPAVREILGEKGRAFVLFKPQFECEGRGLKKSGILPVDRHFELLSSFYDLCMDLCLSPRKITPAPIKEKKNIEYVVFLEKYGQNTPKSTFMQEIANIIKKTHKKY